LRFLSFTSILGVMSCFGSKSTTARIHPHQLMPNSHTRYLDRWPCKARRSRLNPSTHDTVPVP
jgi:hypothetical protein